MVTQVAVRVKEAVVHQAIHVTLRVKRVAVEYRCRRYVLLSLIFTHRVGSSAIFPKLY